MAKIVNKTEKPKKQVNYAQVFARKQSTQGRIKKVCPKADARKGIYAFYRIDEQGFKFAYVGQSGARDGLIGRLAEHLIGSQHIDNSIRSHGLYDEQNNPYGYKIIICAYCNTQEELNQKEQEFIKKFADNGYQLRNKTIGSQGKGKTGLENAKPSKTYRDGIVQGQKSTKAKVKVYFDKYLDYSIKDKPTKIKEKKLQEFKQFLEGNEEGGEQ